MQDQENTSSNLIVLVNYKGLDLPFRESELKLWDLMSKSEKDNMYLRFKEFAKKKKVIQVDGGYVERKFAKKKGLI